MLLVHIVYELHLIFSPSVFFCLQIIIVKNVIFFPSGLDIGWRIRHELAKTEGVELTHQTRIFRSERYSSLADRLHDHGRLGRKTGDFFFLN